MNYIRIYSQLIEHRRENPIDKDYKGSVEYHHIIPISEGGENVPRYKKYNYFGSNLVGLTVKEHILAHQLLARIYNDQQMWCAISLMMTVNKTKIKSLRLASIAKMKAIEFNRLNRIGKHCSDSTKQKISLANKGKKRSEDFKQKMRELNIGRKQSYKTIQKRSISLKGKNKNKILSEETKQKISLAKKGKKKTKEAKQKTIDFLTNSRFINNGIIHKKVRIINGQIPEPYKSLGFIFGCLTKVSLETKKKISNSLKSK